jgi:hypothetical protein
MEPWPTHELMDCPLDLESTILFGVDAIDCSPAILQMIESLPSPCRSEESLKESFSILDSDTGVHLKVIHEQSFYLCQHSVPGGHLLCILPVDKLIQLYHRPLKTCGKVLYSIHMSEVGKILASYPVHLNGKHLLEFIANKDVALLCQTLSIVAKRQQKRIVTVRWNDSQESLSSLSTISSLSGSLGAIPNGNDPFLVTLTLLPSVSIEKTIQYLVLVQLKDPTPASSWSLSSLIPQTLSYLFK